MPIRRLSELPFEQQGRESCRDPDHKLPGYIALEPGTYEHICPHCQKRTVFIVPVPARLKEPEVRIDTWTKEPGDPLDEPVVRW